MIKKKIFYVSVNGSDRPLTMEIVDVMNKDELLLAIAHELRVTLEFVKVLSRRDNILSVFSVSDYLVSFEQEYSFSSFENVVSFVQEKIPDISILDLFYLWLTQFPMQTLTSDPEPLNRILSAYNIAIQDVLEELEDWKEQYEQRRQDIDRLYGEMEVRLDSIYNNQCAKENIIPFAIRKIRVFVTIPFEHSLYYYFDRARLSTDWIIAFYKDVVRTNGVLDMTVDELNDILTDRDVEKVTIYHRDLEQYLTIEESVEDSSHLKVTMDIRPYEDSDLIRQQIQTMLDVETDGSYKTLSVSGVLYFKDVNYEKLTFHDFIMNDKVANHSFYMNELEKASRFGENVTLQFEGTLTAILINSRNDISPKPSSLSFFRGDYIKVNVTRASGSQNDLDNVIRFQNICCSLLKRYMGMYNEYRRLYEKIIPALKFPIIQSLTSEEEMDVDMTNFADKYKNVFRKTGYKTSCRPKSRMPTIITEDEAKGTNPLKVIKFPKDGDTMLGIPQEYLTCKDPEYAFPGITSLSGGTLFVPCCFNKNPRSSKSFLEYYKGQKSTEPRGTEHIKSEYQIIKTFGDVGKIPTGIHQFLVALMPEQQFYRLGTEDSPNTVLHSLNFLKDGEKKTDDDLRKEILKFFGENVSVARQENWDMNNLDIVKSLQDDSIYFDPRKYIRLLEVFFNVNIVLFTKSKKTEELQILAPDHKSFYIRYAFDSELPFVFLYEHWGTSPDRYTKRLHPVCEMITTQNQKTFMLNDETTDFLNLTYRNIFRLSPIHQNCPLIPSTLRCRKQIIDAWGKCRGFLCEIKPGRHVYIESSVPLPPIYIANEEREVVLSNDILTVDELKTAFPGMKMKVVLSYTNKFYARFELGSYVWRVRVKRPMTTSEVRVEEQMFPVMYFDPSTEVRESDDVPTIAREKQLARMILDYTLYLYSLHFMDSLDFERFFDQYTLIREAYSYPLKLSENVRENPMIMDGNRLILPSREVRRRLQFNLQYYMIYRYDELKRYGSVRNLPNFYETPYDFMHWKHVHYLPVFERLLQHKSYLYVDRCNIKDIVKDDGYWFNIQQNPISNSRNPYKFVRVESEEQAVGISYFWRRHQYIPMNREIGIPDDVGQWDVYRWDEDSMSWTSSFTGLEEDVMRVYVCTNREAKMYVFLQIKN